jgi:hypothetical protein
MSDTVSRVCLTDPGGVSMIPVPNEIEHADPGGSYLNDAYVFSDLIVIIKMESYFVYIKLFARSHQILGE